MPLLPEELLVLIFSHLQPPIANTAQEDSAVLKHAGIENATLYSVSLCSKAFRRLALPILYHSVELSSTRDGLLSDRTPGRLPWDLQPLLRTILRRPELAQYIKRIKATIPDSEDDGYWHEREGYHNPFVWINHDRAPDLEVAANCSHALQQFHLVSTTQDWIIKDISHGKHEAEMVLFLHLCKAVEVLHLVSRGREGHHLFVVTCDSIGRAVKGPSPTLPHIFANLEELIIGRPEFPSPSDTDDFTFNALRKFLYHANVKTLKLYNLPFGEDARALQRSLSLTTLIIHDCWTDEYDIERALKAWRNLQRLELVFNQREALRGPGDLGASVGRVTGTPIGTSTDFAKYGLKLEHVVWDSCLDEASERQSPFRQPPALKMVRTTMDLLLGSASWNSDGSPLTPYVRSLSESLPATVESLTLIRLYEEIQRAHREVAAQHIERDVLGLCQSRKCMDLREVVLEWESGPERVKRLNSRLSPDWSAEAEDTWVVLRRRPGFNLNAG